MTAKSSTPSARRRSKAVKLSKFGALRRMKAIRRAVRLQARYFLRLEAVNSKIANALAARSLLLSEVQALTEGVSTTDSSPSLSEVGEDEMSESAIEAIVSSVESTTSDLSLASTESPTSTRRRSKRSATASGESSAS